jgi:hypothetical protein
MRATLSNDEQKILDRIVLATSAGEDEVSAHAMTPKAAERLSGRMTPKATEKLSSRATYAANPDEDEVAAHAMTPKATEKLSSRMAGAIRVSFNAETGEYLEK